MTNNSLLNPIAFSVFLVMICFSLGCEQQRYNPSKWAPASGSDGTLPGVGQLGMNTSTGTMPSRMGSGTMPGRGIGEGTLPSRYGSYLANTSSLPSRAGSDTLPGRMGTSTLPGRQQFVVTKPKKKVKPPLPSLEDKPVWDTREKQQMPRVSGKLGLYMDENNQGLIGLPSNAFQQNGSGSTLPGRTGSTLPYRGSRFGSSTLPGR